MGNTYSIFWGIPPSIEILKTSQKQQIFADIKLIVILADASSSKKDSNCDKHIFSELVNGLKNIGFLVLVLYRNLSDDKILSDPNKGLLHNIVKVLREKQKEFYDRSIIFNITDTVFMSYDSLANVLIKAFDTTDRIKDMKKIYNKILSNSRTANMKHEVFEGGYDNLITYEQVFLNTKSLILLNPTDIDIFNKYIKIQKKVFIVTTNEFSIKDSTLSKYKAVCDGGFRADRVENITASELLQIRNNINKINFDSSKFKTFVDHITDISYSQV